jgi:hypothetical protein
MQVLMFSQRCDQGFGLLGCNTRISEKCVSHIVDIKYKRKRVFERPKCRWKDNCKLDLIIVCMCSLGTSDVSERSSSAESRLQTHPTSSTASSSLNEVKSRVQFYDHGNRFEGDHQHQIKVKRIFPREYEVSLSMHTYLYICGHYLGARIAQLP